MRFSSTSRAWTVDNVLRRAANSERSRKVEGFASYLQEIEADAFASAFLLQIG